MRSLIAVALIASASSVLATPITSAPAAEASLAPFSENGDHIDDSYIVVFKKGVSTDQIALHLTGVQAWHAVDVSCNLALCDAVFQSETRLWDQ